MTMKKNKKHSAVFSLLIALAVISLLLFSIMPQGKLFWATVKKAFDLQTKPQTEDIYPLNIYCLSVGKADAIIISCEGEYALLDAATFDKAEEVELALHHLGVQELTAVFASHPDDDHIGGMAALLSQFPVKQFIQPDLPVDLVEENEEQQRVLDTIYAHALPLTTAQAGDVFTVGAAQIEVLGPLKTYVAVNNDSLVLKLTYNNFSMLFCGDMEKRAEEDLLQTGVDLQADCIKIAHHGSKTSSTDSFLEAVNASYAIVSTGADRNNLPRNEVLKRIESHDMTIYRTDLDGTITISSNGEEILITTEKEHKTNEKTNH